MKRWSGAVIVYLVLGSGLLAGWAAKTALGMEIGGTGERLTIPADQRGSPGGYRTFHFWYSGFHGGK